MTGDEIIITTLMVKRKVSLEKDPTDNRSRDQTEIGKCKKKN